MKTLSQNTLYSLRGGVSAYLAAQLAGFLIRNLRDVRRWMGSGGGVSAPPVEEVTRNRGFRESEATPAL